MARMSSPLFERRSWSQSAVRLVALREIVLRGIFPGAVLLACLLVASDAFGCPNCKDAVNTSDLISSFGIYVWREMQRQKRAGLSLTDQAVEPSQGRFSSEPITPPHA